MEVFSETSKVLGRLSGPGVAADMVLPSANLVMSTRQLRRRSEIRQAVRDDGLNDFDGISPLMARSLFARLVSNSGSNRLEGLRRTRCAGRGLVRNGGDGRGGDAMAWESERHHRLRHRFRRSVAYLRRPAVSGLSSPAIL
jgi:hypothetical protein